MSNTTIEACVTSVTVVYDSLTRVTQWLQKNKIEYTTEQRFEGLMGEFGYLRFDIWLPYYNIVIEVDGQQHYQAKRNDSIESFLKKRDYGRRKELFCLQHGMRLIRLVYDELPYLDRILGFLLTDGVNNNE